MLLKIVVLAVCVDVALGCFGLGGCGGCGMSCGRYCARAKGARTLAVDGNPIGAGKKHQNPDEEFMACCQDRGLPPTCLSKCNYRSYTAATLRSMFFRVDACPIEAASAIHFCASGGKDHRTCCGRNGVGATEAGARCFLFCDEEPRNQTQLDLSYLPCLERFEQMKQCFWSDAVQSRQSSSPYSRNPLPQTSAVNLRPESPRSFGPVSPQGPVTNQFGLSRFDGFNGFAAQSYSGVKPLQPLAVSPL